MKKIVSLLSIVLMSLFSMQAQTIIGRFNYDSLHASNVLCTYGNYREFNNYDTNGNFQGPYANIGVIDNGPNDYGWHNHTGSRHTIHTDTAARDTTSNFKLRCIPLGSSSAVRLGSLYEAYRCQAIAYNFTVDTTQNDMLVINATLVSGGETNLHPATKRERLYLELLDTSGNQYGYLDMTGNISRSSGSSGYLNFAWDTGANSYCGFHDWTPINLDLRPYHGKNIILRFTTFSCGQGGDNHGGYSYYTVNYHNSSLVTLPNPAMSNGIVFRAPEGYMKYEWFLDSAPSDVFDSAQSVTIPAGASFSCQVTDYFGNTRTFRSKSVPRRPHSDFAYSAESIGNNTFILSLTNLAQLFDTSDNTSLPDLEDFHWIFDTNSLCYQRNPVIETSQGWHTVSLVTNSGSTGLSDTLTRTIYLSSENVTITAQNTEIKIFPNPATDRVTVEGCHIDNVYAIDISGRTIAVPHTAFDINVSGLPKGIYALRIATSDGRTAVSRLVKK